MLAIQHVMAGRKFDHSPTGCVPMVFIRVIAGKLNGFRMLQRGLNVHGRISGEARPTVLASLRKTDHTEFMVLVLQLYDGYRGSILGFAREKVLSVEQIALVPPIIVSTEFSVLPGFAPAGVGPWEKNKSVPHMKDRDTLYSV